MLRIACGDPGTKSTAIDVRDDDDANEQIDGEEAPDRDDADEEDDQVGLVVLFGAVVDVG